MSNPLGTATTIPVLLAQLHPFYSFVMAFNLHLQFSSSCSITTSGAKIAYGTSRSRFRVRTGPQAAAEGKNRGEARADSLPWFCFFAFFFFAHSCFFFSFVGNSAPREACKEGMV